MPTPTTATDATTAVLLNVLTSFVSSSDTSSPSPPSSTIALKGVGKGTATAIHRNTLGNCSSTSILLYFQINLSPSINNKTQISRHSKDVSRESQHGLP